MPLRKRGSDATQAPRRPAYEKSLALLARREYSRSELEARLVRDGYDRQETGAALDRLAAEHYQSDQRFAEMLVRNRIAQGYGPRRLQAELRTHGIDDRRIQDLLEGAEVDWARSAMAQLQRRYGDAAAPGFEQRAKRAQFLLRRGFDAATVNRVTRVDVDATDPED